QLFISLTYIKCWKFCTLARILTLVGVWTHMSWLMNAIQCQRTGKKKPSNTIGPPLVVTEKIEPVVLDVLHEYSILVQLGYKHLFKRPVDVEATKREVMLAIQNAVFGEFYDDLHRAMHL